MASKRSRTFRNCGSDPTGTPIASILRSSEIRHDSVHPRVARCSVALPCRRACCSRRSPRPRPRRARRRRRLRRARRPRSSRHRASGSIACRARTVPRSSRSSATSACAAGRRGLDRRRAQEPRGPARQGRGAAVLHHQGKRQAGRREARRHAREVGAWRGDRLARAHARRRRQGFGHPRAAIAAVAGARRCDRRRVRRLRLLSPPVERRARQAGQRALRRAHPRGRRRGDQASRPRDLRRHDAPAASRRRRPRPRRRSGRPSAIQSAAPATCAGSGRPSSPSIAG